MFEKIISADINVTFVTSDINKILIALGQVKVNKFNKLTLINDVDVSRRKKKDLKKILREVLSNTGVEAFETMLMSSSENDFKYAKRLNMQFILVSNKKADKCKNIGNISQVSLLS